MDGIRSAYCRGISAGLYLGEFAIYGTREDWSDREASITFEPERLCLQSYSGSVCVTHSRIYS